MPIKIFRSDQLGAPTINGVSGSLITALDAILVNGYGQVSVTSISRSSSTATVVTSGPHGFETGDVAMITGAGQAAYNGEQLVTRISATSFSFAVAGEPATPATGTITSKRAPAGFSKPFSGTSKGVYRSNDVSSRRHYYRVVDTGLTSGGAREALLTGFVSMADVDSGVDSYPSAGQSSVGMYWQKSDTSDSVGRHWVLITDGKTVYHFAYIQATTNSTGTYQSIENPGTNMSAAAFGDLVEFKPGDPYCAFVTGASAPNVFTSAQYCGLFNAAVSITNSVAMSNNQPLICMARDFTAVPGVRLGQVFASALSGSLGMNSYISYPHMVDNGFYMTPVLVTQGAPALIRARMPGAYESLHGACFPNASVIENIQGFTGRKFMMMYGKNSSSVGSCVIDITGPWDV